MSFWYGHDFAAVAEMPMSAIKAYLERLPARLAEMKLVLSEAASIPHLQDEDRRSTLEDWREQAGIREAEAEIASPAVLKLMGIGVVKHGNSG